MVVRCRPMSKKELASGEYKQVVDVYPSRGVIEIEHPNDSSRENRKMFTYDAVYDKKYVQHNRFHVNKNKISLLLEFQFQTF